MKDETRNVITAVIAISLVIVVGFLAWVVIRNKTIQVNPSKEISQEEFYKEFELWRELTKVLNRKSLEERQNTLNLQEQINVANDLAEIKSRQIQELEERLQNANKRISEIQLQLRTAK